MDTTVLALAVAAFLVIVGGTVIVYLQLRQIHAAVNSNMTTALNKIEDLHARVAELVQEARHTEAEKARKKKAATRKRR